MKLSLSWFALLLTAGLMAMSPSSATAQTEQDIIEVARSVIKTDRQAVVAQTLQLTDAESSSFWPVYHRYRADMDKVGDALLRLVREYAQYYPDVPDQRARKMLTDLGNLEKKHAATRTAYLKKFAKILPPGKILRFAQVESRLDLAMRLGLAANIPLVPVQN